MSAYKENPNCRGCIHITKIGAMYGCNYLFDVGKRRPCEPGAACTVKECRKRGRKKGA